MYRNHGQIDRGRTNLGQSDQGIFPTLTNPKLAWLSDQGNISHVNQFKIDVVESVPKIEESSKVSPPHIQGYD